MAKLAPEEEICGPDCCEEAFLTYFSGPKTVEKPKPPFYFEDQEQAYEIEEPVKVFLFDIPEAEYGKRVMIPAIFSACNVLLGGVCILCFMFPFDEAYADFSLNLHVPLSVLGMIYHPTPGMMAINNFFDSSHTLKYYDRRTEHVLQMAMAFIFLYTGLGIFVWQVDAAYDTLHALIGMGAVGANLTAFLTGGLACMTSVPGPKGSRGRETFMANVHAYVGIAAYAIFIITFATGLKKKFGSWLERLFGRMIRYALVGLTIIFFFVSLIGPCLRFKANKKRSRFEKEFKKRKEREEKEKNKKVLLAK